MHQSALSKVMFPLFGVSALLLASGVFAAWTVHQQQVGVADLVAKDVHAMALIHDLYIQMREARHLLNQYLRTEDESHLTGVESLSDKTERLLQQSRELAHDPEQRTRLAKVEEGYREFQRQLQSALKLSKEERFRELQLLADERIKVLVLDPANACVDLDERVVERATQSSRESARRVGNGLLLLGICGSLAGVLGGLAIARGLRRSLLELHVSVSGTVDRLETVIGPFPTTDFDEPTTLRDGLQELHRRVEQVVAQLHERERELLHNEQLAAMGRLGAALAHEMRNPLTPIKMLVQMAQKRGDSGSLNARELEIISSEISRLEHSIQSFLDFARPPVLERRRADLRQSATNAVELVMGRCRAQDIDVALDFPLEECWLEHDPTQIKQVVLNLLLNALDVVQPQGQLRVAVRKQFNAAESSCDSRVLEGTWLRIVDDGPGIPAEDLERIFEPFATTKESGTGLGLAICRRIVEAHGGRISVASTIGEGTTFSIWLPLRAATVEADAG